MPPDSTPPGLPPASVPRPNPDRPRAPRLPGTYAANYESDMNWRRGVAVLWVLAVAVAVGEAMCAAIYFLRGNAAYASLFTLGLLCAEGALFLALWLGWGWLRWVLAGTAFARAAWFVIWLLAAREATLHGQGTDAAGFGLDSIPPLWLAVVYMTTAVYVAFSADVLDFLRHRREEGRGWVVAPVTFLVISYLFAMLNAPFLYLEWLKWEKASALKFVTQSLETISGEHWNVAAYETRADPKYLETWYTEDRKNVFAALSKLGAFRRSEQPNVLAGSGPDATSGGFVVNASCDLGPVEFAHGTVPMTWNVTRDLFGPWKLQAFSPQDPKFDPSRTHEAH